MVWQREKSFVGISILPLTISLMKSDAETLPGLPDPFAVVTVDGQQTKSTTVIKKTLNPYWNESFILCVTPWISL
jgi:Ca2+-dependent lipid-binding protein